MKKLVLLMGLPGAGKDTQANLLEERSGYKVIRVGEQVRALAKSNPSLFNQEVHGNLAPPDIVNGIVKKDIIAAPNNSTIVCNGYPRNMQQAKALNQVQESGLAKIVRAIFIDLPENEVLTRLTKRNREDDNTAAVKKRIEIFRNSTQEVLRYYESKNLLKTINGVGDLDEINQRITKAIA